VSEKKKDEKTSKNPKADLPLSQLFLDCSKDKYRLVSLATRWAVEIKQRDQSSLPPQELLNSALREILTGQADPEEIEKLPPVPKVEKKQEPVLKLAPEKENHKETKDEDED
jgi:DNA-directed RNA polymerase subunit K/omega